MPTFLTQIIGATVGSTMPLLAVIVVSALFLEDATTVVVGLLVADGLVPISVALIGLYIGIALGDTVLYTLGFFARTHPRLARYIDHDFTAPFRSWLSHRYRFKIFLGHFVPGLRFTTFSASGFFRFPLIEYIPSTVVGGLLLEAGLFSISYWFGSLTTRWIGPLRWGVALIFLVILVYIARQNVLTYRKEKEEHTGGDIPVQ